MDDQLSRRLSENVKQLRLARGFTQQQMSKLAGVPRATWANLESGSGNPTLWVVHRVAQALQVTLEELVSSPRSTTQLYPRAQLPTRSPPGGAHLRKLLPDSIPGMELDRLELAPGVRMTGVPHTTGTREYLTCEQGEIQVIIAGARWTLQAGDVLVFQGDQRHSYLNPGASVAVGYSVVVLVLAIPAVSPLFDRETPKSRSSTGQRAAASEAAKSLER